MKKLMLPFVFIATFEGYNSSAQISTGTINDFQDGSVQNWTAGGAGADPVNIADVGDLGVGDNVLEVTSTGGVEPNANLVIENTSSAWAGNWIMAGVRYITFRANNVGPDPVTLRIGIDGAGGTFSSATGAALSPGSGWVQVNIPVQSTDFIADGGRDITGTLSAVSAVRISGSLAASYNGEPVAATLQVDDITPDNQPVPVELAYFRARVQQNAVTLNWATQTEIGSDYFAVMQSSDGVHWQELTRIYAAGNSGTQRNYNWKDLVPVAGDNYYRLRMADRWGNSVYSNVEILKVRTIGANQGLVIYPNPSYNGTIFVKGDINAPLGIYTSLGVDVTSQVVFNSYIDNQYEINIQMLNKGLYYLKTNNEVKAFMKY